MPRKPRSMPAMTPAECRLGLCARKVKRLRRSTSEVRLALPYSLLKNQKMAFPMSESAAIRNFRRSCADRVDHSNMETAWLTSVA
jgi:hypothetical protein